MKANELMIGDWVFNKNVNKPMQVYPMMFSQMFHQRPDATTEDYNIFPIPITPEILEANGFTRSKVFVEWKYEDDNTYILWKPFPWIKIEMEDHTVMFPCEYVHELQHALRLCGIDKDIIIKKEA